MPTAADSPFEVLLFSLDPAHAAAAEAAGMHGVIVDWERHGKGERQRAFDTEVNQAGVAELVAMRASLRGRLFCRINNVPVLRAEEARAAVEHGADEVWLPMVRTLAEIEEVLDALAGRAELGILVETGAALQLAPRLRTLPLRRVYVGLHDLRIDLGHADLFAPLVDGTLDRFREHYDGPLGVAGITHPALGSPIPQVLLMAAMARLRCSFGVARRSFRRDLAAAALPAGMAAIQTQMAALAARGIDDIAAAHAELAQRVALVGSATAA